MENKFFTFIKPYLSYIDNGNLFRKPFSWLYTIIAILNLLLPIGVMVEAIQNRVFQASAKFIIVFLLIWIVVVFVSWISFQLWWDRKTKVKATSSENDDFVATPVFSHFIQTFGEWLGTWIAVVGFVSALFMTIFLGHDASALSYSMGIPFVKTGVLNIVLMPIIGFLTIVVSRFLAEQFKALASIANNTRKN